MKRKMSLLKVLMACAIALVLVACGGQTPTVQKYKALNVAADLRIAILQGAGSYHTMGLIDDETARKILEIDGYVQEAGKLATTKLN